jgi:AcrR family transcriptional regulator
VDGALLPDDLSQRGLDDPGSNELGAHPVRGPTRNADHDLFLARGYELDRACVVLEERTQNVINELLHRLAHGRSMENCASKRKQRWAILRRMSEPVRTRLQVDVRRQQLLELGLELFGTQTYDELSIDEIAKRAGVSKGLLYHYFPSKRAFYVASVQEAARQLVEETNIDQHGTGSAPDPVGAEVALRAFLGFVSRRRVVYAFLLRSGIGSDPEVAEILEGTRKALIDRALSRFSRFGARPDDPATRLRLRGWIGYLEAASLDWAERQEIDLEAFLALLLEMAAVVFAAVLQPADP